MLGSGAAASTPRTLQVRGSRNADHVLLVELPVTETSVPYCDFAAPFRIER